MCSCYPLRFYLHLSVRSFQCLFLSLDPSLLFFALCLLCQLNKNNIVFLGFGSSVCFCPLFRMVASCLSVSCYLRTLYILGGLLFIIPLSPRRRLLVSLVFRIYLQTLLFCLLVCRWYLFHKLPSL